MECDGRVSFGGGIMKVKDLISELLKANPDADVVIQRNHDKGYYSHFSIAVNTIHPSGSIVLHPIDLIDGPGELKEEKKHYPSRRLIAPKWTPGGGSGDLW
jgi:hypothetical protein